jgi:hypothetical protein
VRMRKISLLLFTSEEGTISSSEKGEREKGECEKGQSYAHDLSGMSVISGYLYLLELCYHADATLYFGYLIGLD